MGIFSKRARAVFAAVGADLAARQVSNAEAQTWGEEVEGAVQAARGGGWDASGSLANRATHDAEAAGFTYLQTDVSPWRLHIKDSATSGDWNSNAQPDVDSVSGWDAEGTLANRATYDDEDAGYKYLQTDVNPWLLHTKDSATSGDWNATPQVAFQTQTREILTGNRTYYVSTTGSDSNDGLSSGAPFATLQKAIDTIWDTLDLYGNDVTIDTADGTYTAGVAITGRLVGKGSVTILGDVTTPSNVLISTTGDCFNVQDRAELTLDGIKMTSSSGDAIHCEDGTVYSRRVDFGSVNFRHMDCRRFGKVFLESDYTISGGGQAHFYAVEKAMIICPNRDIDIVGTLNFGDAFAVVNQVSFLRANSLSFTGDAANTTGKEYEVDFNGSVNIGGASTSGYFPGDSAGTTANGGQI